VADEPSAPPNVVVFVTDDQPRDTLAVMPSVRKWFVEGGTWFPNAVVTTPLCCPSRSTIMSGRYAHNHGVTQNSAPELVAALDQSKTIQATLDGAGYRTGIFGKFLNSWPLSSDPPHWDRWGIHNSSTAYWNPTLNLDGTQTTLSGFEPDLLGDLATGFLEQGESQDATPWYLYVATVAPHSPYSPATRYKGVAVPGWSGNPAVFEADRSDKPSIVRKQTGTFDQGTSVRAQQLRALMAFDDTVDRVMTRIESLGEQDTLAVFLSDNGLMWGEHGVVGHKRLPYPQSVGVPFGLRWPGRVAAGAVDGRIVANVDVTPTIADATATPLAWEPDGVSALSGARRDRILLEYFRSPDASGFPTWASTLTPTWQYTEYYGSDGQTVTFREYYDLLVDPWQNENLLKDGTTANDPDVGALGAALATERACLGGDCLELAVPDGSPPSVPQDVRVGIGPTGGAVVSWEPASDDVGVVSYSVLRDGSAIGIVGSTRFADVSGPAEASAAYEVVATDGAGNHSEPSARVWYTFPPPGTLLADGFESGDLVAWPSRTGTTAAVAGGRTGRFESRFVGEGTPAFIRRSLSASPPAVRIAAEVRLVSRAANAVLLLRGIGADGLGVVQVFVRPDGSLAYRVERSGALRISTFTMALDTWLRIELSVDGALSPARVRLAVDGVPVLDMDEPSGVVPLAKLQLGDGATGRTFDLRVDDVSAVAV
jgi:arylsulfatase A-like enzyme